MKKYNGIILSFLLCLSSVMTGCYDTESRQNVLKVYNWGDYIDEDVLAAFPEWYKEQTGEDIRVIYQTFDINEIMLTKIERGHEDFDVVCPSEYIIERMIRKDLLLPIDTVFGDTPNYLHNQSEYIRKEIDKLGRPDRPASQYTIGYMWGTAGILYNKSHVSTDEASTWESLWDSKFRNKLLMKDSYRDAYGTAVIYANREKLKSGELTVEDLMNNYSPEAIATAEKYLKALKPNIAGWEADFGKEMMTKNKAYLNMTWSGDAVWAIEEAEAVGVKLGYEVPAEGSNVWFDGWVIPKYSRNRKAASYFINYLCQPDVALANMETTGYVSVIATPEILEEKTDTTIDTHVNLSYFFGPGHNDVQINPIQYPDSSTVARCAIIRDAGDRTEAVMEMWSHVKGDNLGGGIVMVILITLAALVVYVGYNKVKKYKHKRLQRGRKRRRIRKTIPNVLQLFICVIIMTGCTGGSSKQNKSKSDTLPNLCTTIADPILPGNNNFVKADSTETIIYKVEPIRRDIYTGKDISPDSLYMCTEYDYYPLPTNEVNIIITNKSSKEYTCGDKYSIAYYNGNSKQWEPLPVNPISEDMLWIISPYHNVRMQTIHIYTDIAPNRPGKYRIYKPFNDKTEVAFAEFEMVDNNGVRKLMDSMWKKVTSLPRTDTIRENISTACQLHDGDTISVGLINNDMPYQEMFRKRILNYSALDFGKITPTEPLPFTTTSDTMDISMRTEKPVYPVGTEEIPVKISNNNDRMLFFGLDYGIARKEGDEWLVLNTSTVWNSVGILIEKGRDYNFKAHMYNLVNDNKPGTYKVYKRIGFDGSRKEWYMSAEFKLE